MKKILGFSAIAITLVVGISALLENQTVSPTAELAPNYIADNAQRTAFAKEQQAIFSDPPKTDDIVEIDLEARKTDLKIGENTIDAWTYNGERPGQTIRIKHGQKLRVNFKNNLDEATTIHWHGVRVPNEMDGVPYVTQNPVEPGDTFVYEFTPKDAGTFWFHPHKNSSEQVERGLYGVLIVENPKVASSFSQDVSWVLDDWLIRDGKLYERFNTPHDLMHDGRWGNTPTVNGETDARLDVNPGERIRLRLTNAANGRVFKPNFGNIPVRVLAVDGVPVFGSVDISTLEIAPGNRIDVSFVVPESLAGKTINVTDRFTRNRFRIGTIDVSETPVETPELRLPKNTAVSWDGVSSLAPDYTANLDARRGGKMGIEWTINNATYPNHTPIKIDKEFAVIDFKNKSARLHPMHLHGQFFRVVSRDGKQVHEPFWRDTILVDPNETVRIALAPLEKGEWLTHCRILEHAAAGMQTTMQVR